MENYHYYYVFEQLIFLIATVEVHSLKSVLNFMPEFKDLSSFPGPLVAGTTHKGEVIQFCQNKILDAKRKEGTRDDIGRIISHNFSKVKFNLKNNFIHIISN